MVIFIIIRVHFQAICTDGSHFGKGKASRPFGAFSLLISMSIIKIQV